MKSSISKKPTYGEFFHFQQTLRILAFLFDALIFLLLFLSRKKEE